MLVVASAVRGGGTSTDSETGAEHLGSVLRLAVGWAASRWPGTLTQAAGYLFVVGIVLFSGSLYVLALGGPRWLGPVTPVGGTVLIVGWVLLAVYAWRR